MPPPEQLDAPADRPLILLSNDDGIDAPGLHALVAALASLGTLAVVAPAQEQSAVGHAITVRNPMRAHPWPIEADGTAVWARAVTGTPADCVKIACQRLLPRPPDLVASGINHGPNTAVNVIYSGTVSAATEAAILGIPSMAISHCAWGRDSNMVAASMWARRIAEQVLQNGLPTGVLLNVNVPDGALEDVVGVEVTRQARARWEEEFEERFDPTERPYYWLGGRFVNLDEGHDTDLDAVGRGVVSITPLHYDLTAYEYLTELQAREW